MASDRQVQARRREAILDILAGDRKITEQRELVERLHEMGIAATQSSISRDLKFLGATRTQGYYEIPAWVEGEESSPFRQVAPFIRRVRQAGPYQLFIVTAPGAGRVVAQAIAESEWEDIVGILEGDSGVLLLTENFFFQRLLYERIRHYLGKVEDFRIVDME